MSAISRGQLGNRVTLNQLGQFAGANFQGLSIAEMRAAAPLPENSQRIIDDAVTQVGLERLTVVADLLAAGLRYPLPDPLSVTEVQWETESKTGGAFRVMSPEARGEYQLPDRMIHRVPVYITMDDFSLNIRTLRMSQRVGAPLDTSLVTSATRRVNEAIEDAAINGAGVQVNGYETPGLLNAPNANTYTFTNGVTTGGATTAWTHSTKTGQMILTDVLGMIDVMQAVHMYGPYNIYIPTVYGTALAKNWSDGTTTFPTTILSRLQQIQVAGGSLNIKVADRLPANTVLMIQMTSDVVDIIDGQRPTVVPWTSPSGFTFFWAVMAIQVPRVKYNYNGESGILVATI